MWRRPSPWPNTTALSSGDKFGAENSSRSDGGGGTLRNRQKGLFFQHDDGFAWVRSRGTPHSDHCGVTGWTYLPPRVQKLPKWQDRGIIPV